MSKTFIGIHAVFATKNRETTLPKESRRSLFAYIHKTLESHNCHTIRINGVSNHIHIAFNLHPDMALSELMREIKQFTSKWIKESHLFPVFDSWARGYYASSFSYEGMNTVIDYIKNQEIHHNKMALDAEIEWMALKSGLRWHNDDLR